MTSQGTAYVQKELERLAKYQGDTEKEYRTKAACGRDEEKHDYIERADMCAWRKKQLDLAYYNLVKGNNPI